MDTIRLELVKSVIMQTGIYTAILNLRALVRNCLTVGMKCFLMQANGEPDGMHFLDMQTAVIVKAVINTSPLMNVRMCRMRGIRMD